MTDQPTPEQHAHAVLVQNEIAEVLHRLSAEGIDTRVILAGLATATAAAVMTAWGPQAVPSWFDKQADMTRHLAGN